MNESLPHLPPVQAVRADDDVIDLRSLVDAVAGGRWTILGFMLAALLGGAFYAWAASPYYRADALVQVEKKTQSVTGSQTELYELLSGRDSTSTEIELIKSRMVLGRVVDQLRLDIQVTPRYFPLVGRALARRFKAQANQPFAAPLLGQRQFAWGGEKIDISALTLPDALQDVPLTLRAGVNNSYELRDRDGTVLVSGRVGEPANFLDGAGSLFVRDLVAAPGTEFRLQLRRRLEVIQGLARSLQVLERGKLSSVLSISYEHPEPPMAMQIVNAVAGAYQRQNVERRSAEAEQTLAFVSEQLPLVQKDLEIAENALNSYRLSQKSADLTKETELVLQQSVGLESQRVELQQKREESLRRFTSNHPVIQALDAQLQQIGREQEGLAQRVKGLPETQQELLRLSREVEVNNSLYTALLGNAEQLRITKAGTIGNVRVVDLALQPHAAVRPQKGLVLLISLFAGTFVGLLAVLVRRALHRGVSDPAVIERSFHLPTYATIPYAPAQRRLARQIQRGDSTQGILALIEPASPAIEAIRSLRTALHVSQTAGGSNIIMICGPSPALGKSFVAVNLAAAMAMAGRRVVLVDADMRRGHLHQFVGVGRDNGLSDFINGRCTAEQMIHPTPQANLFLVPTGAVPDNPSELLLRSSFDDAVRKLSQQFDTVIVDTAPVLAVADAFIAGRHAGTTLMVLKAGQHSVREIEDTLKRLRTSRVPVHGIVLNQVDRGQPGTSGYDSGYYNYDYQPAKR